MSKFVLFAAATAAATFAGLVVPQSANAGSVKLGTAEGGVMIYYNHTDINGDSQVNGFDERPDNINYAKAQFSAANTHGAGFHFDTAPAPGLPGLFGQTYQSIFSGLTPPNSQFGLDAQYVAPTATNAGGVTAPTVNHYDNTNNSLAGVTSTPAGTTAWAINDYKFGLNGPASPTSNVFNSLFRGTGMTFTITNLTLAGSIYTMTIEGTLKTDGLIHWYTPGTPDGAMNGPLWGLSDTFTYKGTLSYNKAGDTDYFKDFYAGSIDVFADSSLVAGPTAVPLPASAWGGMALLGGLAGKRFMKRRSA